MIVDISTELRDFTYITSLYKCIANYNLMGHQIGRKIGDMLEILTMGAIYKNADLMRHLDTEGKLEGYTSAGHKVEFGFFEDPQRKYNLFGAIECKCVGVEETKFGKKNTVALNIGDYFNMPLSGQWMSKSVSAKIKLISISKSDVTIELTNTSNSNVQRITMSERDNIKLIIDEHENFFHTSPHGNMIAEVPGIIRICRTIKLDKIAASHCTFSLFNCLTGPQTIEKAKQASLVAMDLRKKTDGYWGKEDVNQSTKKMTFIHVICEFSHWEEKSRNVILTCIDHNLIVPDAILMKAFEKFEEVFGTENMLDYISKKQFESDSTVRQTIFDILDFFDEHIFYDIVQNTYVALSYSNNTLSVNAL